MKSEDEARTLFDHVAAVFDASPVSTLSECQIAGPTLHLTPSCFADFKSYVVSRHSDLGQWTAWRREANADERLSCGIESKIGKRYFLYATFEPHPQGGGKRRRNHDANEPVQWSAPVSAIGL